MIKIKQLFCRHKMIRHWHKEDIIICGKDKAIITEMLVMECSSCRKQIVKHMPK